MSIAVYRELAQMRNACMESVCLSQLTASDELAQMRNTHLAFKESVRI